MSPYQVHFVLGIALVLGGNAHAQVYRCLEKGQVIYSDTPCTQGRKTDRVIEVAPPPPAALPVALDGKATTPAGKKSSFSKSANSPTITFFYDPNGEPGEIPSGRVELVIQQAAAAWSSGCNVNLVYGGIRTDGVKKNGQLKEIDAPVIRWTGELGNATIPGTRAEVAGTGSTTSGVRLNPLNVGAAGLKRVITHEIGHVLGIGHIHEDKNSVMSYLASGDSRAAANLSPSDYYSCNLAMKQRFGVEFEAPAGVKETKMTDVEAIEKRDREIREKNLKQLR